MSEWDTFVTLLFCEEHFVTTCTFFQMSLESSLLMALRLVHLTPRQGKTDFFSRSPYNNSEHLYYSCWPSVVPIATLLS